MVNKDLLLRDPRLRVQQACPPLGQVSNISRTGILILTSTPLPVGSMLDLKCSIPGDDPVTLEGVGEVVRNQANPVGMGVAFIMLTDSSFKQLDAMLMRRLGTSAAIPAV